jgi:hypothetical protein
MSGLAALLAGHTQPGLYQWHNAAHVPDVAHAVEHAGWRFAYLDGWTVEDTASFLKAAGAALELPGYDGESFDALAAGLDGADAAGHPGTVLLWDGWSPYARAEEEGFSRALGVLRDRVAADGKDAFAVVLRGEGPSIDVPELPVAAPH